MKTNTILSTDQYTAARRQRLDRIRALRSLLQSVNLLPVSERAFSALKIRENIRAELAALSSMR